MSLPAFCTILARNYLPKALALQASLAEHMPAAVLQVFVIDADSDPLPQLEGLSFLPRSVLGLPEGEVQDLAMMYDLVEFATCVKPLVLEHLLRDSEEAFYLDPDTYVTAPIDELSTALERSPGGILLTPHFLEPLAPGQVSGFGESHLLYAGVYNLGFCGVDRRARPFLRWWWGHLRTECLHDVLSGLFVDQKWVDVGSVLFSASSLRHPGYNVSVANLHERPVVRDPERGYLIDTADVPLRLFHFHAFDAARPEQITTRVHGVEVDARSAEAVGRLCQEYAAVVLDRAALLGPLAPYAFNADSSGRRITRRMRAAYRDALLAGDRPPSPFAAEQAAEYSRWRHASWRAVGRRLLGDSVKAARCVLPEEYGLLKKRFPAFAGSVRRRVVDDGGIWG